jgi:hypothetical protein
MTQIVELPVVAGAAGAAILTELLAARKTIIVTGVVGVVQVQASADGFNFTTVATFAEYNRADQAVEVSAAFMRVTALKGNAAKAYVMAEAGTIKADIVPSDGASFDVSEFGPNTTLIVSGLTAGSISFEISGDGSNWSPDFKTFSADGLITKEIDARYIRAVKSSLANAGFVVGIVSEVSDASSIASLDAEGLAQGYAIAWLQTQQSYIKSALSGDFLQVLLTTPKTISAAALNAAAAGTFMYPFFAEMRNSLGSVMDWANFVVKEGAAANEGEFIVADTIADVDVGPATVADTAWVDGQLTAVVTFDTDAGATKTYVAGEEITIEIHVSPTDLLLGFTIPLVTQTFDVVA